MSPGPAPAARRPRRFAPLALPLLLALAAPPGGAAGAPAVAAVPGGLVRWAGDGIEACEAAGRRWPPLAGACLYPIDLAAAPGVLAVARWRAGVREAAAIRVLDSPYPVQRITIEDTGKVELSPESLARVERERRRVGRLWAADGPGRFALPLAPPLEPLPAAGGFGARRFFNDQPRSPHSGADFAAAAGTPVLASAAGRVVLADDLFFSGESVFIDHGAGLVTMYFHLSERLVEEGAEVRRGQAVGRVGATGRASGPHLHFGVRWRGARLDPTLLLAAPESLPALP